MKSACVSDKPQGIRRVCQVTLCMAHTDVGQVVLGRNMQMLHEQLSQIRLRNGMFLSQRSNMKRIGVMVLDVGFNPLINLRGRVLRIPQSESGERL